MKLGSKIQLFSTIFLFVILVTINSAIYFLFHKVTTDEELERLTNKTETIATTLNSAENKIDPNLLLASFIPSDGMIRIINEDSKAILTQVKSNTLTESTPVYHTSQLAEIREVNGSSYAVASLPLIWYDGEIVTLETTESMAGVEANLAILKIILVLATVLAILPTYLLAKLLSKLILRPVEALISTMEEIQKNKQFKHIELAHKSKDELYKMGTTFNAMIDILQMNFKKQKSFVSNASHELRTPLTIIESYASLLKRWGTKKPEVFDESVEAIHSEAIRMKTMIEQLLVLARNEDDWNIDWQVINLVTICEVSAKTFQQAYGRKVNIMSSEPEIQALGDEQKIRQVLYILFDNAKKYSEKDIDVIIKWDDDKPMIMIKDYGAGIPKADMEKVFDRFYRVDKARNRKTGGTGLGLAIASEIITAHEGTIELQSEEGVGTSVIIRMKKAGDGT